MRSRGSESRHRVTTIRPRSKRVAALVEALEQHVGRKGSVGVGIPGTLSPVADLVKNANSVWLIGMPLLADLERRLDREVRLANDANCFARSEAADGAGAGAEVVFGVIVGTGTGAGIVVRGEVLTGPNGIAGEWGHNPLPWPTDAERPGPACYCGRHGCIERFLSGPGMQADYERATGRVRRPTEIVAAADAGDGAARETLARYEQRMARALAGVVNMLDPDVIVLGGGMSNIALALRTRSKPMGTLHLCHGRYRARENPARARASRRCERRPRRGVALARRVTPGEWSAGNRARSERVEALPSTPALRRRP